MKTFARMDFKILSIATAVHLTAVSAIEITHYKLDNSLYKSMPILQTITGTDAYITCVAECATTEQCSGSKMEHLDIGASTTCKLIGYKTLNTTDTQMDITRAFFKSDFDLCPDGFTRILNSCYKFISDDNDRDGKPELNTQILVRNYTPVILQFRKSVECLVPGSFNFLKNLCF